jgi:hypothetical protein
MQAFYFGCWQREGHSFFAPGMRAVAGPVSPWGFGVDQGILHAAHFRAQGARRDDEQREGVAVVAHQDAWTALSFWDRSVDTRKGSHSTFVFDGLLSGEGALAAARVLFPEVFERFTFEVKLA